MVLHIHVSVEMFAQLKFKYLGFTDSILSFHGTRFCFGPMKITSSGVMLSCSVSNCQIVILSILWSFFSFIFFSSTPNRIIYIS